MPDVDDLTPGQVLADASVAEFIKSLGLSIAEAQQALDENSINQIGEFITPRESLAGRTLLDMGLSPAFYHYQHADISCSMQLSLRVEKDLSVGVNLSGSFNDQSTSNESNTQTSESSESGSTNVTEERSAQVEIQSASTGALTIGGQNFPLSGADPLARIRALQEAVTSNEQAGVPRLLYEPSDRTFTITTDADADKVQTTPNTVAFLGGGFDSAVIQMDSDTNTDYVFNGSTTINTTAQGALPAYAAHVETQVEAAGYDADLLAPGIGYTTAQFKTGRHHFEVFELDGTTYNENGLDGMMKFAQFARARNLDIEVIGYADAQRYRGQSPGRSAASNVALGQRRADEIKRILVSNGMDPGKITTSSNGSAEAEANVAGGGPRDDITYRRAEIKIPTGPHFLIVHSPNSSLTINNIA
ncbi:MAG: OmpA family protein, partial [Pseudomonadota bacterium]